MTDRAQPTQSDTGAVLCPNCKGRGHEGLGDLEDDYPCRSCFGMGIACVDCGRELRRGQCRECEDSWRI